MTFALEAVMVLVYLVGVALGLSLLAWLLRQTLR